MIVLIVLLSTLLAFVQEARAGHAETRLRALVRTHATVLRRTHAESEGLPRDVSLPELVPGDIVHLCAGDIVPADVRVLSARDLFVNEGALTGESLPVEKYADAAQAASALALPNVALHGDARGERHGDRGGGRDRRGYLFRRRGAGDDRATGAPTAFDDGIRRFTWLMLRIHGGHGAAGVRWSTASPRATGWRRCCSPWRWRWASRPRCCR